MDGLQRLLDKDEITVLKSRYCRFLDTKDWPALRALFTDDAWFEGYASAPGGGTLDMYMAGVSTWLTDVPAVHQCHTPEITFHDSLRARAVWAERDFYERSDTGSDGALQVRRIFGFGHYEEEYRKVAGTWKIAFIRLVRTTMFSIPPGPIPAGTPRLSANPDWLHFTDLGQR